MKTKHIIAAMSAAVIAGSVFYYLVRKRNIAVSANPPVKQAKNAEEKIRQVMHHAKTMYS